MTQDRTSEPVVKEEHPVPDGGWGWVVCLTSALTNGTIFSLLNTFGVLFVAIVSEHGDGLEDANFKTCEFLFMFTKLHSETKEENSCCSGSVHFHRYCVVR